ncbi:MAG TPA: single-stranded-DNA-specific exonuclease RecJ [Puia sp.]|nr:single-stranded-DNA-specific exonuclease RecJ [Puia sp.]
MHKRWNILQADPTESAALQWHLHIHPVLCRILARRGITTPGQVEKYFHPSLEDLHSPWLMKDMEKAVARILRAFEKKEKILIYGDYDVDGTTAVACMVRFLRKVHPPECIDYYIPHRYKEGYGISMSGIELAAENGFSLVISMDCGISSAIYIAMAKDLGVDFIVCDHHLPSNILPPAVAILNPKQEDCNYPYKDLCGCGVGFKFITALCQRLGLPDDEPYQYLDLVVTAIAADIVPVDGENRIIAWHGLERINSSPNNGIKALIQSSGLTRPLKFTDLIFILAPRINAVGRMDDAGKVVELFTTPHSEEAQTFADILHTMNAERKTTDSNITEEAMDMLKNDNSYTDKKSIVLYRENWHKGVIGIVASRLTEKFARPTIVLTRNGGVVSGSGRSFTGFNMYAAIHACRDHLVDYGGHPAAAGLTLQPDQVEAFTQKFEEIVSATIDIQSMEPELHIDAEISFSDIDSSFFGTLEAMEPFGPENPRPVFITRNVIDKGYTKIVKEQHIRFYIAQYGQSVSFKGIGYNLADKFPLLAGRQPIDIAYCLEENEWNGRTYIQLKILDLNPGNDL